MSPEAGARELSGKVRRRWKFQPLITQISQIQKKLYAFVFQSVRSVVRFLFLSPSSTAIPVARAGVLLHNGCMAKIAILVEKIYEDLELQYPKYRLKEAGHEVHVIGPKAGEIYVGKHGYPQKAEFSASDVKAKDYALIVIPGGTSPDHMRRSEHMVKFAQDADKLGLPMAAICHGPWLLCSTKALRGRKCTSYMSIVHDVINAGGKWVDEACVVDGPIITARTPDDLPAFMKAILSFVETGKAEGTVGKPVAPAWVKDVI